ncbi:MAG: class I SAM-dependent methyltransferase [Acidimicrobiales bacterium]
MPDAEGLALARLASRVGALEGVASTVVVEVGAYCGRSTAYLAHGVLAGFARLHGVAAAALVSPPTVIFSVDHHRGSEENQAGWEHHDASLVDAGNGRMDTLPLWRHTVEAAGIEAITVALVGDSPTIAARWTTPAGMVFVDGGHGSEPAWADYRGWAPHVAVGGFLAIHDVFPNPADGGRPPYEIYCRALESAAFEECGELGQGSLRVLKRLGPGT